VLYFYRKVEPNKAEGCAHLFTVEIFLFYFAIGVVVFDNEDVK
jgi:hypothetical protein